MNEDMNGRRDELIVEARAIMPALVRFTQDAGAFIAEAEGQPAEDVHTILAAMQHLCWIHTDVENTYSQPWHDRIHKILQRAPGEWHQWLDSPRHNEGTHDGRFAVYCDCGWCFNVPTFVEALRLLAGHRIGHGQDPTWDDWNVTTVRDDPDEVSQEDCDSAAREAADLGPLYDPLAVA